MDEKALLGLPLDEALETLEADGIVPQITYTCAPARGDRAPRCAGSARVVRYARGVLTVSRFIDHVVEAEDGLC
ncbi:MAG: hypothetical protein RSJ41_09150 [Clostridia bacterium]